MLHAAFHDDAHDRNYSHPHDDVPHGHGDHDGVPYDHDRSCIHLHDDAPHAYAKHSFLLPLPHLRYQ